MKRTSPWAIAACAVLIPLLLIFIAGSLGIFAGGPGPDPIHRSELLSYTPGSDTAIIRCPGCKGTGVLNGHTCAFCGGRGMMPVRVGREGPKILDP